VPIGWYPRLSEATVPERRRWKLVGPGVGIHWPDLDEGAPGEAGDGDGNRSDEDEAGANRAAVAGRAGTCGRVSQIAPAGL
jgi:hypothetical protein